MLKLNNNQKNRYGMKLYNIYLTRGDSAYLTLTIEDDMSNPVELTDEDVVRCQVRTEPTVGTVVFDGLIERSDNEIVWHIRPEDTAALDVGTYYWDAQVELACGDIFTFVPVSEFNVIDEVTMGGE